MSEGGINSVILTPGYIPNFLNERISFIIFIFSINIEYLFIISYSMHNKSMLVYIY